MNRPRIPIEDRFWAKVDKSGDCWEWTGARSSYGYGLFSLGNRKGTNAHRAAYKLTHGDIDPNMYVDHICRNRGCVRPEHLRLVTPGQNVEHQNGHRDSRSGHRGVAWHQGSQKWRVTATKNGKTHFGGAFNDLEKAAEAARLLRLEIFTHNELDRMAAR